MLDIDRITDTIKALVTKAEHATEKARQFYVSAGQHLKTLKDSCESAATWEKLVREKCGLSRTRAYELIAIADGRSTVEQMRADTKERVRRHRAAARPLRNGQPESPAPASFDPDTAAAISCLAFRLIELDPALARDLRRALQLGHTARLVAELNAGLEIEENANGRGYLDPGPIPDCLRRSA